MITPDTIQRLEIAIDFVRKGQAFAIGGLQLYGEDAATLCVTGLSQFYSIRHITREIALKELSEVMEGFNRMLEVCPCLLELTGKSRVKFVLACDCGKSSVGICSSEEGVISWDVDLNP